MKNRIVTFNSTSFVTWRTIEMAKFINKTYKMIPSKSIYLKNFSVNTDEGIFRVSYRPKFDITFTRMAKSGMIKK